MNDDSKRKELIERFLNKIKDNGPLSFKSSSFLPQNFVNNPPPINLLVGSLIDLAQTSDVARETMEMLEGWVEPSSEWIGFKWKLWAFFEIQTIFDAPFYDHADELSFFRVWYFYFESRYILLESLLAGLNGLYQSSHTLIRPFFEFNILQNYYYRRTNEAASYLEVNKCLNSGINPKWSTLLRGCLEDNDFTKPIKTRIDAHYAALSNHFSHPYHQDFSPKIAYQSSAPGHSVLGLMSFWVFLDHILECVLWTYYSNFPMLLHPKDITSKFGFNGPVGLFVDSSQEHIFRNALSESDYRSFHRYSETNENVVALSKWFEEMPTLTGEEIKASWNQKEDGDLPEDLEFAKLKKYAKLKVLAEAMSLKSLKPKDLDHIDLSKIDLSYEGWKKISQKKKRKKK